ncbi:hypothetical protein PCL_03850 [Purpureocillium lilacinum]|uniref:Uncharacterized protein n=1 Tax=Purpureocillium lilacinum TaxID=33203 RepID=A0A2U3EQ59_PURLI|nr:hypothetical protein PCL_03850 [Purpureocillium lilacinum]
MLRGLKRGRAGSRPATDRRKFCRQLLRQAELEGLCRLMPSPARTLSAACCLLRTYSYGLSPMKPSPTSRQLTNGKPGQITARAASGPAPTLVLRNAENISTAYRRDQSHCIAPSRVCLPACALHGRPSLPARAVLWSLSGLARRARARRRAKARCRPRASTRCPGRTEYIQTHAACRSIPRPTDGPVASARKGICSVVTLPFPSIRKAHIDTPQPLRYPRTRPRGPRASEMGAFVCHGALEVCNRWWNPAMRALIGSDGSSEQKKKNRNQKKAADLTATGGWWQGVPVAAHCAWEEASRCVHSKALGWREDGAGIALRRNATQRAHRKHPPCLSTGRLLGRRCENGKLPLAARGAVGSGQDTRFARLCHRRGSRVRRRRADSSDDFRAPEEKTRRLLIRDMAQLGRTAASEGGLTWPDGPIVENTYRRAGRARTRSVVDSGWWCVAAWQVVCRQSVRWPPDRDGMG